MTLLGEGVAHRGLQNGESAVFQIFLGGELAHREQVVLAIENLCVVVAEEHEISWGEVFEAVVLGRGDGG